MKVILGNVLCGKRIVQNFYKAVLFFQKKYALSDRRN